MLVTVSLLSARLAYLNGKGRIISSISKRVSSGVNNGRFNSFSERISSSIEGQNHNVAYDTNNIRDSIHENVTVFLNNGNNGNANNHLHKLYGQKSLSTLSTMTTSTFTSTTIPVPINNMRCSYYSTTPAVNASGNYKNIQFHEQENSYNDKNFKAAINDINHEYDDDDNNNDYAEPDNFDYRRFRVDTRISFAQWKRKTARLTANIDKSSYSIRSNGGYFKDNYAKQYTDRDILDAASCVRYWTKKRTPQAVDYSLDLMRFILLKLQANPQVLKTNKKHDDIHNNVDTEEKSPFANWYSGRYPRMSHLLNAALDCWRISFERGLHDNEPLDLQSSRNRSPSLSAVEMFDLLVNDWQQEVPYLFLNYRTFTLIMQAAVLQHKPNTPEFCKRLTEFMIESGDTRIYPDSLTMALAVKSALLARRSSLALEMLNNFRMWHNNGLIPTHPNVVVYNTVIDAFVHDLSHASMIQAERILWLMLTEKHATAAPNEVTYRFIALGWCRRKVLSTETWMRSKKMVDKMAKQLNDNSVDPASIKVLPDTSFYANLMIAAMNLKRFDWVDEVCQDLHEIHSRTKMDRFAPDVHVYRVMLIRHCAMKQPENAQKLLESMIKTALEKNDYMSHPKFSHFIDVCNCLVRVDNHKGAERAERIFYMAVEAADRGMIRLSDSILEIVLYGWTRSSRPDASERATQLYNYYVERFGNLTENADKCKNHLERIARRY